MRKKCFKSFSWRSDMVGQRAADNTMTNERGESVGEVSARGGSLFAVAADDRIPHLMSGDTNGPNRTLAAQSTCCGRSPHCRHSPRARNQRLLELTLCGQTGLLPTQRMLVQKLLVLAASRLWQCGEFPETGRSFTSELVDHKPTLRCGVPQQSRRGTRHRGQNQRCGWPY